jgi:tetratricopeptide (TPR) repeat protein
LALDATEDAARARVLRGVAEMAAFSSDTTAMRSWAEEALVLSRRIGDERGTAESLFLLGVAVGEGGDWGDACPLLEESVELFRALADEPRVMWGTRALAWANGEFDDLQSARVLYEDALQQARAAGNRLLEGALLGSLAWVTRKEGRIEDTPPLLSESLRIKRDLGDRIETAIGLCGAARTIAAMGRPAEAARLISCYEAMSEEIGGRYLWVTRINDETLPLIHSQLGAADFAEAWDQGRRLTADEAVALALEGLTDGPDVAWHR